MKTSRLPPCACPHCGYLMDAATSVSGDREPSPGDVTVCIECEGLCLFDTGFNLRAPHPEQLAAMTDADRNEVALARAALRYAKESTP